MVKTIMGLDLTEEQKLEIKTKLRSKYRSYKEAINAIKEISSEKAKSVSGRPITAQTLSMTFSQSEKSDRSLSPETALAIYLVFDKNSRFDYLRSYAEDQGVYETDFIPKDTEAKMADIKFSKSIEYLPLLYRTVGVDDKRIIANSLERIIHDVEGENK